MSGTKYEIFLPVLFIVLFLVLLFAIYALNNLEIGARLCNACFAYFSCCRSGHTMSKNRSRKNHAAFSNPAQWFNTNPYGKNMPDEMHNYYEGPTNGFYRIGSRMNYYSQHFSHFHPAPHLMNANSFKINTIYRSSDDGSSFALPTAHLTASTPPVPLVQQQQQLSQLETMYRSYDSASFENQSSQQQQQCFSKFHNNYASSNTNSNNVNGANTNKVMYFNNISWWPSKIMSEHELRKFINYNYYFDANNVSNIASNFYENTTHAANNNNINNNNNNKTTSMNNDNHNNLSNLVYLRQNFSDLGLMMNSKSQQHLVVKKQTTTGGGGGRNFMNANRLRQKIFSTSSNLFSIGCSSYRLSSTTEYNYNR